MRRLALAAIVLALTFGSNLAAHEQADKLVVAKRLALIPAKAREPEKLKTAVLAWGSGLCPEETTETYWVPRFCESGHDPAAVPGIQYCRQDFVVTQELRLNLVSAVPRRFELVCVETSGPTITGEPYDCLKCGEEPSGQVGG